MKLLVSESRSRLEGIGWSERNVMMLHQQFEAAFRMRLSEDAQRFFAMPEAVGTEQIDYYTFDHDTAQRYSDLAPKERAQIDQRIEAVAEEIESFRRGLHASGDSNDRNIATALDKTFLVPGKGSIWVVDGVPVVTNWGFQAEGQALDIRTIKGPKRPKPAPVAGAGTAPGQPPLWRRALIPGLLALLLLLGLLAYLFGPALLCASGIEDCNAPVAQADEAELPPGAKFVDIDVVANDSDPDGDPITLTSCTAPGAVQDDRTVRLARADATSDSVTFECTVADPAGNTDSAPVTVTLPAPAAPATAEPNQPAQGATPDEPPAASGPEVETVTAFLPIDQRNVEIDVLSGIRNPAPGDDWQVTECTPPGELTGPTVSYTRNPDETITREDFACTVTNSDGDTLEIPVEVTIGHEAARCQPFTRNLPVRLLIGADWSFSMDTGDRIGKVLDALTQLRRDLPDETDATVELMSGNKIIDLRQEGAAFLADPASRGRTNPNFAAYFDWLRQEIDKAGEEYALITVVTITDAQDDPSGILPTFRAAFEGAKVPIEHTLITLTTPKTEELRAQYQQLVWPPDEPRNYRELLDPASQARLPSEILQAARMTVREGCESP